MYKKNKIALEALVIACFGAICIWGCTKYKDPAPQSTPTLTTHYCNTPSAVNYNWGFPGIPDSSVCIFPAEVYSGNYTFYDSLQDGTGIFLPFDTISICIVKKTDTSIAIQNFCSNAIQFTANVARNLRFTLDSSNAIGQVACNPTDTINGYAQKKLLNDSSFTFYYNLYTASGIAVHKGLLKK